MKLTKEEKADRYDSLQTAIKWTIEQYRKRITELELYGRSEAALVMSQAADAIEKLLNANTHESCTDCPLYDKEHR